MGQKIQNDVKRFKDIVRGKIKENLKKYITQGEMVARKGKDKVSIPLPQIELPRFKYGKKQQGGVGQGDGNVGDVIGRGDQSGAPGEAGESPGDHILEVDVKLDELAEILGEELQLPNIEPKGKKTIKSIKDKYSSIRRNGPESLRSFKRTFTNALKRQISSGTYDPENPIIVPERADRRYRSWKETSEPESNAVIFLLMDVSGSMGQEQKEIVRLVSFWIQTWLRSQYNNIDIVYIIHDAAAKEVDEETFFHTRESGGTKISSAYKLLVDIIKERYDHNEWNIYPFHFSDGDNWAGEDTDLCIKLLDEEILAMVNLFCYGQVKSAYGSGEFIKDIIKNFDNHEKVIHKQIEAREDVLDSIKTFLGKGK